MAKKLVLFVLLCFAISGTVECDPANGSEGSSDATKTVTVENNSTGYASGNIQQSYVR